MRNRTIIGLSLLSVLSACATPRQTAKIDEAPQAQTTAKVETPVPTPAPKMALDADSSYTIVKHDTLWGISSRKMAYEDPYYWPALYRANRDVIEDPDLIYIKEQIKIPKGLSEGDMQDAKKRALKAPAFEPHTSPKPRDQLEYLLD